MLFFNEDWLHYLITRFEKNMPINEKSLKEFIYQYKDTQITDFCLNVNGMVSSAPSEIFETFCDRYKLTEEKGVNVDYKNTYAKVSYTIQEELGLDNYKIWVDTLREINIRPWISIRMNDRHGDPNNPQLRNTVFKDEHPELLKVKHRKFTHGDGHDFCFDYSIYEARKRHLDYIEEMLNRYMPDGLELDFTREMDFVAIGSEYESFELITSFIKEVRELVKQAQSKVGHKISLGILIADNITATFNQGYDVKDWCDKKLVDFVTIISRWDSNDTNKDIGLWKKLITKDVKFGTGLQLLINPTAQGNGKIAAIDQDFGQAVANLSLGAEYIYLYNHMDILEEYDYWVSAGMLPKNSIRDENNLKIILNNIGALETAMNFKRRHTLTYNDCVAPWENVNHRLPLYINEEHKQLRIAVGSLRKTDKVELVIGFEEKVDIEDLEVYINSNSIKFISNSEKIDDNNFLYSFRVPDDIIKSYAIVELAYKEIVKLNFAEIVVN